MVKPDEFSFKAGKEFPIKWLCILGIRDQTWQLGPQFFIEHSLVTSMSKIETYFLLMFNKRQLLALIYR